MIRVTHSIKTPDSADEISNTPSGTISSTNVQDALNELDGDVVALDASLGTAAVEDVGTSGHTLPFLDGANTWSADQSFTTGIDFGSDVASSATDLSRHLTLYGTGYGFSVTASSLNYVVNPGASHNWYSSSSRLMTLSDTGILNIPRVGTAQAIEITGGDAGGQYITGLAATGAAKTIHYNSTTDSSNSAPSGGSNGHIFEIRGADVLSITDDRIVVLDNGQLQFPSAQNSSTNANTLDDYEEGTFTPVVEGSVSAGTGTYSSQIGNYVKIGRFVFIMLTVAWSAHTGTGNTIVSGLPFGVVTQNSTFSVEPNTFTLPNANEYMTAVGSAATIVLRRMATGGGTLASVPIDTSATLRVAGWHMTSA